MSQQELTKRILDRLCKQVAFGGMTKRKTTEGEIILNCPFYLDGREEGNLTPLASDLTCIFVNYIEEEGLKQIKVLIKDILK